MNKLYQIIEKLCADNGENITQMCKAAGVPRGNITDLKMGRQSGLSGNNLRKIAEHFGITVDYLITGENKKIAQTETDLDDEIVEKMKALDEREDMRGMLEALVNRSELRAMLHAGKDATPEQIEGLVEMLRRFKGE